MSEIRSYRELMQLASFEERLAYLRLAGTVGADTFGFDRWLNQQFYSSQEWKQVRNKVIARDGGCDLGIPDRPIPGKIYVHHMNPVTKEDLEKGDRALFLGPEYLICVSHETHNLIHYGGKAREASLPTERKPNDTCPWKR